MQLAFCKLGLSLQAPGFNKIYPSPYLDVLAGRNGRTFAGRGDSGECVDAWMRKCVRERGCRG